MGGITPPSCSHWLICRVALFFSSCASCQIRIFAGCACTGNAGNVFPATDFKGNGLVSDPGMHQGTCVTHVPWCKSGSLTRGGGENVPGIPGACATRKFTYLARGPYYIPYITYTVFCCVLFCCGFVRSPQWSYVTDKDMILQIALRLLITPDNKVHGANMGPIWGRQDPGGPHVGPMNLVIWDSVRWWAYLRYLC